ncbi:MAG TPA: chromate transporter [Hyphomicrobiaceae bacterium]|nr:chromate transporter [Hyphomicrobiaceae bacterium]
MRDDHLWTLLLVFVPMSLLSIGGGGSILAPMYHQTIEVHGWLTPREFIDLFAISRAAPGPGATVVTLVGWKVAGWTGALVASIAIFLPSSILCFIAARVWNRYRGTRLHSALERGLAPVGTGLLFAGAIAVLRAAETGPLGWAIAGAATALLVWRSLHPLPVLFAGGILYMAGTRLIS